MIFLGVGYTSHNNGPATILMPEESKLRFRYIAKTHFLSESYWTMIRQFIQITIKVVTVYFELLGLEGHVTPHNLRNDDIMGRGGGGFNNTFVYFNSFF